MLTCLCDAFAGEVGIAAVRVLEAAGCDVEFLDAQTCCGQPPFNSGDWDAARTVARRTAALFQGDVPVVAPSSSCTAMMREGYAMLLPGESTPSTFELVEFLVRELGVTAWPPSPGPAMERSIAFHRACHGRGLHLGDLHEQLLSTVPGLQMLPFAQVEQCCGFGGAFAATHGPISAGIGMEKLEHLLASGADTVVSGDMGCLLHLRGLIERHGLAMRTQHVAQILAEAVPQ
ncbi:MAG: (Fe-S)-binding protein [Fimbriimonadaceae bacterium]|nr:(Fe-S)-binding protein [Fimbriimonadaceae bacterium]